PPEVEPEVEDSGRTVLGAGAFRFAAGAPARQCAGPRERSAARRRARGLRARGRLAIVPRHGPACRRRNADLDRVRAVGRVRDDLAAAPRSAGLPAVTPGAA